MSSSKRLRVLLTTVVCSLSLSRPVDAGPYAYETEYITVPVDHFSFTNNDTFSMKYLINDTYWKPNDDGPIFFYAGNEGAIEMFCDNTGYMWETAEEFGALLVFAEHRYYGQSMPYGSESFDDKSRLGYLTSEQALADYVDLIAYLRRRRRREDDGPRPPPRYGDGDTAPETSDPRYPVIVFGGSYGGMLAAWFRIKYPAVVEGAIASSAPIWQFTGMTPCNAFYRVTSSAYTDASAECGSTVSASWKAIDNVTKTAEGRLWLSEKWKLCRPLSTGGDVLNLKDWMSELLVELAMVNYPYPANFLAPLPGYPIKEFCKPLNNHRENDSNLLGSVFEALNVYFNYTGTSKCLNVSTSATPSLGERGWDYQICTEIVMPLCSNGVKDIFEKKPWNFEEFAKYCYKTYGVRPVVDIIEKNYGGKNLNAASNIIFSNGLLDPWSSGGVLQNISKTVRAVIIPESAHHLDLRASNAKDPESVIKARKFYKKWIRKWITDYRKRSLRDPIDSFVKQQIVRQKTV